MRGSVRPSRLKNRKRPIRGTPGSADAEMVSRENVGEHFSGGADGLNSAVRLAVDCI